MHAMHPCLPQPQDLCVWNLALPLELPLEFNRFFKQLKWKLQIGNRVCMMLVYCPRPRISNFLKFKAHLSYGDELLLYSLPFISITDFTKIYKGVK